MPPHRRPPRRLSRRTAAVLGVLVVLAVALALVLRDGALRGGDGDAAPSDGTARADGDVERSPAIATHERLPTGTAGTRAVPAFEQRLVGRIVDRAGRPAAGARLLLESAGFAPREVAACDADGAFDVAVALERVPQTLALAAPWSLDATVQITTEPWDAARTLVATRRVALRGRILEEDDRAVGGVLVAWRITSTAATGAARTDAQGRFDLDDAVALPGLEIEVRSPRFEHAAAAVDVPPASPAGRNAVDDIVLRVRTVADRLVGRVLDADGAPLEARLALGPRTVRSGAESGEFALDLRGLAPGDDPLVVAAKGYAPAVLPDVGLEFVRRGRRHPSLEIVLAPAGRVAGRVLTHDGQPAEGARVSIREAAPLFDEYAEQIASATGELVREIDADGAFALDGLERRVYTVVAVDPQTLDHVELEVEPWTDADDDAGRAVELRLPPPDERRAVRGSLRYPDGSPAGGLSIYAFVELPGQPVLDQRFQRSASVAADGTFVLDDLPRQDLQVAASDVTYPRETPLPAAASELHLVIQRLCPVVLEWPVDADPPDRGHALDARGARMELFQSRWGRFVEDARLHFAAPRAGAGGFLEEELWVPESATTLVVARDGREMLRLPLAPSPGRKDRTRP